MKLVLSGASATRNILQQAKTRMAQQGVRKAVRAAGEVIQAAIEERAPVLDEKTAGSTALDPGSLRADINTRTSTRDGVVTAIVGPGSDTAHVANWVEYGHRLVKGGRSKVLANGKTQGQGEEIGFVQARPYIRPGFEASAEDALAAFNNEIKNQLGEAVK